MAFILTADDFGKTNEINAAVLKAHKHGTIQAASLMMGEDATQQAVDLAKANPTLRVGLHLVFVDGKSVLPYAEIPDLIDFSRHFPRDPAYTWLKYLFSRKLRAQLEKETRAQFEAFRLSGLKLSHVDGHHHQHLHPGVFKLVVALAKEQGAEWVRIPRENLNVWKEVATQRTWLKKLHGLIFYALTRGKQKTLKQFGFRTMDAVFGLIETHNLTKEYVLKLFETNPLGANELFFHPGADWNRDLEILLDPQVGQAFRDKELQFI